MNIVYVCLQCGAVWSEDIYPCPAENDEGKCGGKVVPRDVKFPPDTAFSQYHIIVNGLRLTVRQRLLTYDHALAYAGYGPNDLHRVLTVVYSKAAAPKREGILYRGSAPAYLQDGTIINVADTSRA